MVQREVIKRIGQFYMSPDQEMKKLAQTMLEEVMVTSTEELDEVNNILMQEALGMDIPLLIPTPEIWEQCKVNEGRLVVLEEGECNIF